jgi:N-acetylmuramoyl-L-alanine amidase
MNRRWKGAAAALVVAVDRATLTAEQGWVEDGTSYMTLRAYAALTGSALSWDGSCATLTGNGLTLKAVPGQLYVTANDRCLYVEGGVRVEEGKLVLPLRVLAQAAGAKLSWDEGTATALLDTAGAQPPSADYDEEDLYWLARIISAESQGEPLTGQIAVGNVVLNRVADSQFPDTVKGVVFDRTDGVQFEPVANGAIYDEPTQSALVAAKLCLEGARVAGDSLYFYAPALSAGSWIVSHCTYYATIGCHKFYL